MEARRRIGGRLHTITLDGERVELGGTWNSSTSNLTKEDGGTIGSNPISQWATDCGKVKRKVPLYTSHVEWRVHAANGSEVNKDFASNWLNAMYNYASTSGQSALDVAAAIRQSQGLTAGGTRENMLLANYIEHEYGMRAESLSIKSLYEGATYHYASGGTDEWYSGGYTTLLKCASSGLDIRLRKVVTNIDSSTSPVRVTTKGGTVFTGDKVLVTVPLGVLKRGNLTFTPALANANGGDNQGAINRLIMGGHAGSLNKIILKYSTSWWPDNVDYRFYHAPTYGKYSEFTTLQDYDSAWASKAMFVFQGGDEGVAVENRVAGTVAAEVKPTLQTMFAGTVVPDPVRTRITKWHTDRYSYGSYSGLGVNATPQDRATGRTPISGKVYFAGEHFSTKYPATMMGAYTTGLYAAEQMLAAQWPSSNPGIIGPPPELAESMVWRHSTTGAVSEWVITQPMAHDGSHSWGTVAAHWTMVGVGDVDDDGWDDFIWFNNSNRLVHYWKIVDGQKVLAADISTLDPGWELRGVGDLDGDGTEDLIFWHLSTGAVHWWRMQDGAVASMAATDVTIPKVSGGWDLRGAADVVGEGYAQLIWHHGTTREVHYHHIYDGVYSGSLISSTVPAAGWSLTGQGDASGDGVDDLFWRNTSGALQVWTMLDGQVSAVTDLGVVPSDWHLMGGGELRTAP